MTRVDFPIPDSPAHTHTQWGRGVTDELKASPEFKGSQVDCRAVASHKLTALLLFLGVLDKQMSFNVEHFLKVFRLRI